MRKRLLYGAGATILLSSLLFVALFFSKKIETENDEHEEYENLQERFDQEFQQLKDPALGYIPKERLIAANNFVEQQKRLNRTNNYSWQERGPVYDVVGPSNGNPRGGVGNNYTAGIVQTFLVDANDASGNTILAGSPSGGLFRCTNFLSNAVPNWVPVNDFQANLAIASICQNPASPNIMYIATGDANTRDVRGYGIWKSTNSGNTWSLIPGTTNFTQAFKILCDNSGNLYLATGGNGLQRSTDGGNTWTNISPSSSSLPGVVNPSYVPDIEISSTGRLHAVFGYYGTSSGAKCQHVYTDNPATVNSTSWNFSSGIRVGTTTACSRIEIATQGNILYAVTANSAHNIDSCYKSVDGGATWTKQNTAVYTTGLGSGQAWFAVTLQINPDNPSEFLVGGLDAYRSSDDGVSISRVTYWVSFAPYVHADHHCMQWYKSGTESRVIIGCDGGLFLSKDGGSSWTDKNQNLGIKQFYSCAIDPSSGVNYMLAGAQDNGCHQLKQAGLSWSTEVTGGDGSFVYVNQQNPQIQFCSYLYNQYRRSTNGGNTWTAVNVSNSNGLWTNPFDYDDAQNILYGSWTAGNIMRLPNANTVAGGTVPSSNYDVVPVATFGTGKAASFKFSPYTSDRLFVGSTNAKLVRIDGASTASPTITDIGGGFFTGNLSCVAVGTTDNDLVATFTNYGVTHVWYSSNGGNTWTDISSSTLPDIPVWWAVFEPGSNNKLIIATETGVYTATINGTSTVWTPETNFPTVRTRMLKVRSSDGTVVAATYGRGIWTAVVNNTCPPPTITTQPVAIARCVGTTANFSVVASGTGLTYQWRKDGTNISGATSATLTLNNITAADAGNYDVVITNNCGTSVTSNAVALTITPATSITTQPVAQTTCVGSTATFTVVAANATGYQWRKNGVTISGATGSTLTLTNISATDAANYDVVVIGACNSVTSASVALTVSTAPSITIQPTTQTICAGANVSFSVAASGSGTVTYQWRKGGSNISGATSATYTITGATTADAGTYDVVVTNSCGSVTSTSVALIVNPATTITTQPTAQSACPGSNAFFTVAATGTSLTYQWRKGGVNISGATSATLTLNSVTAADAANYDVVVTGTCGSVTSNAVALTVSTAPSITTQPANQTGCPGGTAAFSVTASGSGLTYQWRKGGTNISGATSATLTLNNLTAADAASYDVVITSSCGSNVTSNAATLTLNAATTITTQPTAQTVCIGTNVTFTVAATGSGTLTYQWRKGGSNISGATSTSYTITGVTLANAGTYDVVVTGTCGSVTSSVVSLTVNATSIITQPSAVAVCNGGTASFTVVATGQGTLTYQWRKGGANISGATNATYNISNVVAADAGNYDVVVTGTCGSATSNPVALAVNTCTAIPTVNTDITEIVLMPNKVESNTVLRVKSNKTTKIDWQLIDSRGRIVMLFTQNVLAGKNDLPLKLGTLASGVYQLAGATDKGKITTLRMIKL